MKDVLDFLTKKEVKRLHTLDNETKKTFEVLAQNLLYAIAIDFELLEKKYLQEKQDQMVVAVAYALNQAHGFGKKRLPDVFSDIWATYEMLEDEELSMKECTDTLEENGIIVKTRSLECQNIFYERKDVELEKAVELLIELRDNALGVAKDESPEARELSEGRAEQVVTAIEKVLTELAWSVSKDKLIKKKEEFKKDEKDCTYCNNCCKHYARCKLIDELLRR